MAYFQVFLTSCAPVVVCSCVSVVVLLQLCSNCCFPVFLLMQLCVVVLLQVVLLQLCSNSCFPVFLWMLLCVVLLLQLCVHGLLPGVLMRLCVVALPQLCVHGLLACVQVADALAAATADVAAPDELAVAALHLPHQVCVVAAAAAEQVAAAGAGRATAAAAAPGAGHAPLPVLHAVVRRLVEEDQALAVREGEPLPLLLLLLLLPAALPAGGAGCQLNAALVAALEDGAHAAKRRHRPPAGLDAAGA